MNVLTHEVAKALRDRVNANDPLELIRATEQAVLSKLAAGVSVEPAYLMSPDGKCYAPSKPPLSAGNAEGTLLTLYTASAIAAARVQENERCVQALEALWHSNDDSTKKCIAAIRALIGKEST